MNDTMNERDYVNPVDIHRTYIEKSKNKWEYIQTEK